MPLSCPCPPSLPSSLLAKSQEKPSCSQPRTSLEQLPIFTSCYPSLLAHQGLLLKFTSCNLTRIMKTDITQGSLKQSILKCNKQGWTNAKGFLTSTSPFTAQLS